LLGLVEHYLPVSSQETAYQNSFSLLLQMASQKSLSKSVRNEIIEKLWLFATTKKQGDLIEQWIEKGSVFLPGEDNSPFLKLNEK
jgi:hypothetical protein